MSSSISPAASPPTSYKCIRCTHTFDSLLAYNQHQVNQTLSSANVPRCNKCRIPFYSSCALNFHCNDKHAALDDGVFRGWYTCNHCGDVYEERDKWERHKTGHGVGWVCDLCGNLYFNEAQWDTHMAGCRAENTLE